MFETIERIPLPPADVFFRDHVFKHRPVIITDLFAGQPIASIRTLEDARGRLDDMKVTVTPG